MDANFLIYILNIYRECLLFQFVNRSMRMCIAIIAGTQNASISRQKESHILLRSILFKAYFLR